MSRRLKPARRLLKLVNELNSRLDRYPLVQLPRSSLDHQRLELLRPHKDWGRPPLQRHRLVVKMPLMRPARPKGG